MSSKPRDIVVDISKCFAVILVMVYAVRCVTRVVVQTLQGQGHYDWRAIVKVV